VSVPVSVPVPVPLQNASIAPMKDPISRTAMNGIAEHVVRGEVQAGRGGCIRSTEKDGSEDGRNIRAVSCEVKRVGESRCRGIFDLLGSTTNGIYRRGS
jgi:hypothetical protein